MIAFDSVGTIRNKNALSSKYKLCHFNLTTFPLYLVNLKIAQKGQLLTAVHSVKPIVPNFCRKSFNVCVSSPIC